MEEQIYDSRHTGQEVDEAVEAVKTEIPQQLTQIGSNLDELSRKVGTPHPLYFDQNTTNAKYANAGIAGLYIDTHGDPDFDATKLLVVGFGSAGSLYISYNGVVILSATNADGNVVKMKRENGGVYDGYAMLDIEAVKKIAVSSYYNIYLSPNYIAYISDYFPAATIPEMYSLDYKSSIVLPTPATVSLAPCSCIIDAYGSIVKDYSIIRVEWIRKTQLYAVFCRINYGNNEGYLKSINGQISIEDWEGGVRKLKFYNFDLTIIFSDDIGNLTTAYTVCAADLRVRFVENNKTRSSVKSIFSFSDALNEQIKTCVSQNALAPIPFDTFVVNPDNILSALNAFGNVQDSWATKWWYSESHPCINPENYFGTCYRHNWSEIDEDELDGILAECIDKKTRLGYIGFGMFASKTSAGSDPITKPSDYAQKQSIYEANLAEYNFSFDGSDNFLIDGEKVYTQLPNSVIWEMIEENTLPNFWKDSGADYYMAFPNYNSTKLFDWWKGLVTANAAYLNGSITHNGVTITRKNLIENIRVMFIGIYGEGSCINGGNLCIFPEDDTIFKDYFDLYVDNYTNRLLIPMASTYDRHLYSDATWDYLWTLSNDAGTSGVFCDVFGIDVVPDWLVIGSELSDVLAKYNINQRPFNGEFGGADVGQYGSKLLTALFRYGAYGVSMGNIPNTSPIRKEQFTKFAIAQGGKLFISRPSINGNTLKFRIQNIGISKIYSPYWEAKYVFRDENGAFLSEVAANIDLQSIAPNSQDYEFAGLIGYGTEITETLSIPTGAAKIYFKIADKFGIYPNYYLHNYGRTEDGEYPLIDIPVIDLSMVDISGNPLSARTTANSYIARETGAYRLPLVYGNGIKSGSVNTPAFTRQGTTYTADFVNYKGNIIASPYIETDTQEQATSADLLWQTERGLLSNIGVYDGFLYFSVNDVPDTNALAVICAKNAGGDIMWSWTIWLTKDNISDIVVENHSGVELSMMSEPFGAIWDSARTHYVLPFYQWGRKDPMLPAAAYNSSNTMEVYDIDGNVVSFQTYGVDSDADAGGTERSVANSIKMPGKFFIEHSSPKMFWNNLSSFVNFWNAAVTSGQNNDDDQGSAIKAIYDPMPAGYMIPCARFATGFTTSGGNVASGVPTGCEVIGAWSAGWKYKKNSGDTEGIFIPAGGYRARTSGNIAGAGNNTFAWSYGHSNEYSMTALFAASGQVRTQYNDRAAVAAIVWPAKEI